MPNTTSEPQAADRWIDDRSELAPVIDHLIAELLRSRRRIAVIWSTEDVQTIRPDLGADQRWQVLLQAEQDHDAELGLTWERLAHAAADLYGWRGQTDRRDDGREP